MKKIKPDRKDFVIVMGFYSVQKENGKFKYMFEISVPDKEYDKFLVWLKCMESVGQRFSFWLIERYDNHKLIYGFADFCISEDLKVDYFNFSFENNDILYNTFHLWNEKSSVCIMPDEMVEYLADIKSEM